MKSLLLDTSTKEIGIGVFENRSCLYESYIESEKHYNAVIMGMIEKALKKVRLKPCEIDVYGATLGPGSFTGIRVGMAVAKGLADGSGAAYFGVSTLDVLAYTGEGLGEKKVSLLDARRNEVYMGVYKKAAAVYELTAKENIEKEVKGLCDIYILERDIKLLENAVKNNKGKTVIMEHISMQSFNNLLMDNKKRASRQAVYSAAPLYIRQSDAEIHIKKVNK
ncbi:MAG: tRNA (adenosine(37)-N6)-threonylcarbamoyltransferase complex dimerization subunit type 1 TsaB [Candidatus Goldbacteria bacterium]|nr:tRNA (adenosine(37)-N6)-threonylcarbamoyltransferase complex dimerization subunit type 1 TsaB [Candidatus Goldiibacteriota bacterium]